MRKLLLLAGVCIACTLSAHGADSDKAGADDNKPPEGFIALFNGKNLDNWQGLVEIWKREKMSPEEREKAQKAANEKYLPHWKVEDGILHYDGKGQSLQTVKDYKNFEMWVDWKIPPKGDSGIYLHGYPQVQIWDNPEGSGSLWNNKKAGFKPSKVMDKKVGEWNRFRIVMKDNKASIWLNGELVVDNVTLENYLDRNKGIPDKGPIELQHHGSDLWFKNIYVKELPD
jgi:hypothetical protein